MSTPAAVPAFLAPACMATKNGFVESLVINDTAIVPPVPPPLVAPLAVVPPVVPPLLEGLSLPHAAIANDAATPNAMTVRSARGRLAVLVMFSPPMVDGRASP